MASSVSRLQKALAPGPLDVHAQPSGFGSGAGASRVTVTSKVHWPRLPAVSVAVTVTTVVPTGRVLPEARPYSMTGVSRSSVAVAGA